jgi:predicted nucleic acid-binding protein
MILVDASVWIDHIRAPERTLVELLSSDTVVTHPFVIGEIALGSIRSRAQVLTEMYDLPLTEVAADPEVMRFIERFKLYGLGIGYIDVHLLAATLLTDGATLWTRDKSLRMAAERLGVVAKGLN